MRVGSWSLIRSFLGVALAIGFGAQASLAVEAPRVPARYDWSGFYVGANLGHGRGNADWTNQESAPFATFFDYAPGQTFSHRMSGGVGGGQIGFNYQNGPWVFGIEAMIDATSIKGTFSSNITSGAGDDQFEASIKALLLFTGRIGYAWDRFLAYGKGGIAAVKISTSVNDSVGAFTGSGSDSRWLNGPTLGVGIEYGITPNVSVGVEYDYVRLNSASYQLGGSAGSYLWDVNIRNVSLLMGKLSYRFK